MNSRPNCCTFFGEGQAHGALTYFVRAAQDKAALDQPINRRLRRRWGDANKIGQLFAFTARIIFDEPQRIEIETVIFDAAFGWRKPCLVDGEEAQERTNTLEQVFLWIAHILALFRDSVAATIIRPPATEIFLKNSDNSSSASNPAIVQNS